MSDGKEIKVGDEVEAMCGKCKDATVHVVEAIKDDKVTKVMCKSCLSSHRYRKPAAEGEKKAKKKKTTRKKPSKTKEQRKWSRVMSKVEGEEPQDYKMSEQYEQNDVIDHSKFGLGVVSEVIDLTKVSVVFEEGEKTLVHNRE